MVQHFATAPTVTLLSVCQAYCGRRMQCFGMLLADGSADACGAEGQDPALPGSPQKLPVVPPPPAAPAPDLSPVEQFAQEVRSKAKWGPAVDVNVRGLMASGVMAGQPVHIQLKHKDPVYLQGEQPVCSTLWQDLHDVCPCFPAV